MWQSWTLPQGGFQFGWPGGGMRFHDRIARTFGRFGFLQTLRGGSYGTVRT